MFPVPKITEEFVDSVMRQLKWRRYADLYPIVENQLNADYVGPNSVSELKIFEEEGLEKRERQRAIARLFKPYTTTGDVVDVDIELVPADIKNKFENLVSAPLKTAIKKASKQLKSSALVHGVTGAKVLVAVNNGYSFLNADNFERLLVSRAKRDSKTIDYAACVTVEYHQGGFDAYIFCTTRVHSINASIPWDYEKQFIQIVGDKFDDAMTIMMQDQMNPGLWKNRVEPVAVPGTVYLIAANRAHVA